MYKKIILVIFLLFPAALFSAGGQTDFNNIKISSIYDGDTFNVILPCKYAVFCRKISVRVQDIDAPEIKSKDKCEAAAAQRAKSFTEDFLKSGSVALRACRRDKYFRLLCRVYVGDISLADEILNAGLAVPYKGGKKEKINWCK